MTVWDCFFSALYSPFLEQHFLVSVSIFFVTKISLFHLQNTYLNSEEFCLFEYYEDGQDISCRSMMFGASRLLWEANFLLLSFLQRQKRRLGKIGVVACPILVYVLFYRPKEELMFVCPGIPEDNDCCSFAPRFCYATTFWKASVFCDRSEKNGHGLHLNWIRDTSLLFLS
jgi:hypothetical protein